MRNQDRWGDTGVDPIDPDEERLEREVGDAEERGRMIVQAVTLGKFDRKGRRPRKISKREPDAGK